MLYRRFSIRSLPTLRLALGLVAAVALFSGVSSAAPPLSQRQRDVQERLEDTRQRAEQARTKEERLSEAIAVASEQIDVVEGEASAAAETLRRSEAALAASERELARLDRELKRLTARLELLGRELAAGQRLLAKRAVAIYTSEQPDLVGVALGAGSFDDLIDRVELQRAIVEQDTSLIRQISGLRASVARDRAMTKRVEKRRAMETRRLAAVTSERRSAYATVAARRDALATLRQERQRSLAGVAVDRKRFEAEAQALQAESARIAQLIAAAPPLSSPPSSSATGSPAPAPPSGAGGAYVWPVRGVLTSPFGWRWGRMHEGIDIGAPAGAAVVASASGTVIHAGSMSGYGLLVLVQHPGGVVTAYAHNSAVSVGVGQPVAQGQQIASVGCTGRCFGDHVHFEVRVGGSPADPLGYL